METRHGSMKSEWPPLLFPFPSNRCSSYSFCMLVLKTPAQVAASVHVEVLWKGQPGCSSMLCIMRERSEEDYDRTMNHTSTLFSLSLQWAHHPLFPSPSIFALCCVTHRLGSWVPLKDLEPSSFFSYATSCRTWNV